MGNFQKGDEEKLCGISKGLGFRPGLKFSRGVCNTQFCGASRCEALFCVEFSLVK